MKIAAAVARAKLLPVPVANLIRLANTATTKDVTEAVVEAIQSSNV